MSRSVACLLFASVACLLVLPVAAQDVCEGVSTVSNTTLKAVEVATGTAAPIYVTAPPGDTDRIFIVEQGGVIRIKKRGDAPGTTSVFLDISTLVKSGGEQGLIGMAFSPDYATSGEFYVNYSSGSGLCGIIGGPCEQIIARYSVSANPDVANPDADEIIMEFDEPQTNHNGGQLFFGPDDMLYIATGDGGGADDEGTGHGACGNGQQLSTLLGKILRIDVLGLDPMGTAPDLTCWTGYTVATGFTVPSDNVLADGAGGTCDEIWQYGLRNPWRNSFDRLNGDVYIADVGQNCWEEVNYVAAADTQGVNYGWRQKEGKQCFDHNTPSNCNPTQAPDCSPACSDPSLVDPVIDYPNPADGDSVIGGYVYRGCRMPGFDGTYFYGDNGSGFIRSFEIDVNGQAVNPQTWSTELGGPYAGGLTSFGEDAQGEHYIADAGASRVLKILPPFTAFEVSGTGTLSSDQFLLNADADWTWEDLQFSSDHPVEFYRVYRGQPNDVFDCIHSTTSTSWTGDTTNPASGELLAYVVTGVSAGEETKSGDPDRTLQNPCPAP